MDDKDEAKKNGLHDNQAFAGSCLVTGPASELETAIEHVGDRNANSCGYNSPGLQLGACVNPDELSPEVRFHWGMIACYEWER